MSPDAWLAAILDPATSVRSVVGGLADTTAWDMGRRILPDHMLHAVLAGGQEGVIAGTRVRTRPGDLLWVPPGVEQDLRLATGERRLRKVFLRFTAERAGRPLPWPGGEPLIRPIAGEAAETLRAAARLHTGGGLAAGSRLKALLVLVFAAWFEAAAQRPGTLDPGRRRRLADLLAHDPRRRWDGALLARALDLSPATLARLARRTWDMPLRTWILRQRLRLAGEELRAGGSAIAAVAARHGWEDALLFSRQFRRHLGASPSQWRAAAS